MAEVVTINIKMSTLKELHNKGLRSSDYEVKYVDETVIDYSTDDKWRDLKRASSKAYSELKGREFELRHK